MAIQSYKELFVWQRAIEVVKETYLVTAKLPKSEVYGLASQMRRAAVSIPSNIAEGYKRKHLGEYLQFLSIADASAAELETQMIITNELYPELSVERLESLLTEVQKMLHKLIQQLTT